MGREQVTVPGFVLTGKLSIIIGVVLSVILLGIGVGVGQAGIAVAGTGILSLTLFFGGLLLSEEAVGIRICLLVFGSLLLIILAWAGTIGAALSGWF